MQSLIHAHLPADIVFCRVQAADKPPIVVSETHASTLTQSEKSGSALDVCMHKQDWLFMSHKQPVKRLFTGQHSLFVFCLASACPLYRHAGRQRLA